MPFKTHSALLVTSHSTLRRKESLHADTQVLRQQKGWDRGGGWCHLQGAVHMAVASLGCERAMVGSEWANSCPGCTNGPRKHYSYLLECSFLAGKVAWALSGYLPTENDDCGMFINDWVCLRSQICLLRLEVDLGSLLVSKLGQKWRYGVLLACIG